MILFICSQGRLRSRTAELMCLFGGLEARCSGIDINALQPISDTLLREASIVFCMEPEHHAAIQDFSHYDQKNVHVLNIRDVHNRLAPLLMSQLIQRIENIDPRISEAMDRGRKILESLPGYLNELGTEAPASYSDPDNDAWRVFPKI